MIDPRIIALAKDPRTAPVLASIVESGGDSARAGSALELLEFNNAVNAHGLSFRDDAIGSELLAYVRSVAHDVAETADEAELALAILRDDEPSAGDPWSAHAACDMTDALVDAGLLLPDEPPAPLEITALGRAVLLALEQRAPAR